MEVLFPVNSFIVNNFKRFYYLLLKEKAKATKIILQNDNNTTENEAVEICQNIQHRLHQILEQQEIDALKQVGEFATAHYREAQYLMVAMADEMFLNLDWVGQSWWQNHLLETKIFHTQKAGELFFDRLDVLLKHQDPSKIDLWEVYLLALGLGFRGQYRDTEEDLTHYRQKLYFLITHRPSDLYHGGRDHLIDFPYMYNVQADHTRKLPEISLWMWSFAAIALVYCVISYAFWHSSVKDVKQALDNIIQVAEGAAV